MGILIKAGAEGLSVEGPVSHNEGDKAGPLVGELFSENATPTALAVSAVLALQENRVHDCRSRDYGCMAK